MKVVLIGDSIRMGYQSQVMSALKGRAEVWAPSENGRHGIWILDHFKPWISDQEPDILHINCGIHDVAQIYPDGLPQITADQYELSLRRIVAKMKAELPNTRMIWALSTPLLRKVDGKPKVQWRLQRDIVAYNRIARTVMKGAGIPINDLDGVVMASSPFRCISDDGCHMTPFGYGCLARAVTAAIRNAMKRVEHAIAQADAAIKQGDYARAWRLWQWKRFAAGDAAEPPNLLADMTGLMGDMRRMLADSMIHALLSSDDRAYVEDVLAKANSAIKAKKQVSAWRPLNAPRFRAHYSFLKRRLASLDTQTDVGPFLTQGWKVSNCTQKTGDVSRAPAVRLADKRVGWQAVASDDPDSGRINVHPLCGERDGLAYLANRISVTKPGRFELRLGHDGGAKLFVDGRAVLCDPKNQTGITPDRSRATVALTAGRHDIVVALDLAHGKGWGIRLRLAAANARPMRERDFPFPVLD